MFEQRPHKTKILLLHFFSVLSGEQLTWPGRALRRRITDRKLNGRMDGPADTIKNIPDPRNTFPLSFFPDLLSSSNELCVEWPPIPRSKASIVIANSRKTSHPIFFFQYLLDLISGKGVDRY